MSLHLVQIGLDPRRFARWSTTRSLSADERYAGHALACAAFGDMRPHPFRLDMVGQQVRLMGYADASAADLQERMDETAEPDMAACVVSIEAKAMPVTWRGGRHFSFELVASPTARRGVTGEKRIEKDAFLIALDASGDAVRERVYEDWLRSHFQNSCMTVGDVNIERYVARSSLVRVQGSDGIRKFPRTITLPDVLFRGTVRIGDEGDDPQLLAGLLHDFLRKGVGRHKVCGFGALLLRASRQPQVV